MEENKNSNNNIQFSLQMRSQIKKEEGEQEGEKVPVKQHKYTQKQYYRCYCQKIYTTYPALYLHIKNKHQAKVSMEMKKKLKPKVQWSGNIKKIVYEFLEFSDSSNSSEKQIEDYSKTPIVKEEDNVLLKQEQEVPIGIEQLHSEKKKRSTLMTMQQDNVKSIFKKYKQKSQIEENVEIKGFRFEMLDWFETFLNQNYKQIQPEGRYYNYCLQSTAQNIPHAFSSFYLYMSKKQLCKDALKKELGLFGKWLYDNKYSQYLVIKEEEYQQIKHTIQ